MQNGFSSELPAIRRGRGARIRLANLPMEIAMVCARIPGVSDGLYPRDIARILTKGIPNVAFAGDHDAKHLLEARRKLESKLQERSGFLWKHQVPGVKFLVEREGAILGDEMGLGKSFTAAFAADVVTKADGKIVVLSPASVIVEWIDYIKKVAGEEPQILRGRRPDEKITSRWVLASYGVVVPQRSRTKDGEVRIVETCGLYWIWVDAPMAALRPDRVGPHFRLEVAKHVANMDLAVNFALAWNDIDEPWDGYGIIRSTAPIPSKNIEDRKDLPGWVGELRKVKPTVLICDEGHELLGRRSSTVKKVRELARSCKWVWVLTGTPLPNYTRDLWAQLDIVTDGQFGSNWDFVHYYCDAKKNPHGGIITTGASNEVNLKLRLNELLLRRSLEDTDIELPPKLRKIKRISGYRSTGSLIDDDSDRRIIANNQREAFNLKLPVIVEDTILRVEQGQRVVIFVSFVDHVDRLMQKLSVELRKINNCKLWGVTGSTPGEARGIMCKEFVRHDGPGCFVGTVQSLNAGISLVGARCLIWGDLTPEPHYMVQGGRRVHRPPATKGVEEVFYVVDESVDEAIEESVVSKLDDWEKIIGLGDQTENLRDTLSYDVNAVYKDIFERFVSSIGRR